MRSLAIKLGAALLLASSVATAQNTIIQGRVSASPGLFDFKFNAPGIGSESGDGTIIALDTGLSLIFLNESGGAFLTDLELEAMEIDSGESGADASFNRTDLKFTAGYQFPSRIAPIVGYRYAAQGDGVFDDESYTEAGYFVGVGYSGIPLGEFATLGGSVAYNATTLDFPGQSEDLDADGASARIALNLNEKPLSFSLRYQVFQVDEPTFDFDESYLLLSVTYTYFSKVLGQ